MCKIKKTIGCLICFPYAGVNSIIVQPFPHSFTQAFASPFCVEGRQRQTFAQDKFPQGPSIMGSL